LAGRLRSSKNALRHGLSIPAAANSLADTQPPGSVELLIPEGASELQRLAVFEMVRAQTELQRVAAVRKRLLAKLDLQSPSLEQVRRVAALERYECRAHRQRRQAADRLRGTEPTDGRIE
jgi:hypothetical protein